MSLDLGRNLDVERAYTLGAAESLGIDAEQLVQFAERRAGPGPVRSLLERNLGRETAEELADARNYLVWWADQLRRFTGTVDDALTGEITAEVFGALAHVCAAFEHVAKARAQALELRETAA